MLTLVTPNYKNGRKSKVLTYTITGVGSVNTVLKIKII